MPLLLPPKYEAEIRKRKHVEERERRRALASRLLDFDDPVCREWQPILEKIDQGLRLGKGRPQAYEPGMNVRPGFYHWVCDNSHRGAALTIEPITDDDDGFKVPDSSFLDELRANDLQNPYVWRILVERRAKAEADKEKRVEEDRSRRVSETLERYKAGTQASVSMSDVPWSQAAAGKRGRKS